MTRKELEQIYYLNKELHMWERELERQRGKSLIQSPMPSAVHGSGVSDKVGSLAEKRVDLERLVQDKQAEIQRLKDKAVEYINTIPDSLTRQIIYYRCVSLFGWRKIAFTVGGGNTEESVRKVYTRFFDKKEKLSDLSDLPVV